MTQPIISGFHPDPSICRVGDTYYIANSSFEYSPGVPVHASKDLLRWELLGNALDRPSQLRPSKGTANTGIYAPTLRHHDGRFWLATTDVSRPRDGQLVVHAESAEGPWSDPVFVAGCVGIDPDLVWDEDGTAHLTWTSFHPELSGIASAPVDLATGELLAAPRIIWEGTGRPHIEGPHLYRIGDWWYLLVAEGGTERRHAVSVARSRSIDGPYESNPANPILTHAGLEHPVQNTGHGDLFQLEDGSWAMVHLGVRPQGTSHGFHVNGRETFLVGVDWVDGWPAVVEDRFEVPVADHSFVDDFTAEALHPRWISPGAAPTGLATKTPAGLTLTFDPERPSPSMLLSRARDISWRAEVTLDATAGALRLIVRADDNHWYALTLRAGRAVTELAIGPAVHTSPHPEVVVDGQVTASITVRRLPPPAWGSLPEPDLVGFSITTSDGSTHDLGEFDGRYLSTEVAGGFTGRVWGLEVLEGEVPVHQIRYTSHITETTSSNRQDTP